MAAPAIKRTCEKHGGLVMENMAVFLPNWATPPCFSWPCRVKNGPYPPCFPCLCLYTPVYLAADLGPQGRKPADLPRREPARGHRP